MTENDGSSSKAVFVSSEREWMDSKGLFGSRMRRGGEGREEILTEGRNFN